MLINYAEYEFFKRIGINVSTRIPKFNSKSFNLIIGGGGAYIDKYSCGKNLIFKYLKNPHLKRCIFLPQSINRKCIVLIREPNSYKYCIFNNNRARFIRSNDMALSTRISEFPFELQNHLSYNINDKINCNNPYVYSGENCEYFSEKYYNFSYYNYLNFSNYYIKMFPPTSYMVNNKSVRFYFRNDGEIKISPNIYKNLSYIDASLLNPPPYNEKDKQYVYFWARMFLLMMNNSDVV